MRTLALRERWAAAGASFRTRQGVEVVSVCSTPAEEYHAIRDAAGVTDFSFVRSFRVPEEKGIDFLDALLAGNVAKIRFGRVLHTFLANQEGRLVADVLVANNDQELLVFVESIVPDSELDAILAAGEAARAGVEELTGSHVLLSIDGFKAWQVAKQLFGPDVLGLPYLSIETYPHEGSSIRLIRAGKTSEFGYLLLVPQAAAAGMLAAVQRESEAVGGRLCGVDIHDDLRLEGRFFNIQAEGLRVGDPLVLGLQWMIDLEKPAFLGSEPIRRRRAEGLRQKIVGVALGLGGGGLAPGAQIFHGGKGVAEVVAGAFSHVLDRWLGLAVFPIELAYSGLTFGLGAADGPEVKTISMPPIFPKSLGVKLDEM